MGVPPFSLVILVIWILLVRVIKTQNLPLEESWLLKLLRNSSKFVLIFDKIFKNLNGTYRWPFVSKVSFHAHASSHPHPCVRVKCFQIIFSCLESRFYYDFEKWRAIRAGVVDVLAWVAMCQHGWCEWCASLGKVGGMLALLAWVAS